MSASRNVLMALYFFPRGGSAHVGRYLSGELRRAGWQVDLCTGSLGDASRETNAAGFYGALAPSVVDYSRAETDWRQGQDPMSSLPPMHASYEDKPDVPDRVFARVAPDLMPLQIDAWADCLGAAARGTKPAVLHLHHLTPVHLAADRLWPQTPVLTHLHGTELKMLRAIERTPDRWAHGQWWASALRKIAERSTFTVTVSDHDRAEALDLLPLKNADVATISNGVDTGVFSPKERRPDERLAYWSNLLVEDPRGWLPGDVAGSIRYTSQEVREAFAAPDGNLRPILMFVGRFTAFKRIDVLLEALHMLRSERGETPPLVVWGGFPGEWEGEHPYDHARRLGLSRVFFAGWRGHGDLPLGLSSADIFVAPAVNEPFGQVYLEAMSCGLPVIGTASGGPASFIRTSGDRPNGWLAEPGDAGSLTLCLKRAIDDAADRAWRGRNGRAFVEANYGWRQIARQFQQIYTDIQN